MATPPAIDRRGRGTRHPKAGFPQPAGLQCGQDGIDIATGKSGHSDTGVDQRLFKGMGNGAAHQQFRSQTGNLLCPTERVARSQRHMLLVHHFVTVDIDQQHLLRHIENRGNTALPMGNSYLHTLVQSNGCAMDGNYINLLLIHDVKRILIEFT